MKEHTIIFIGKSGSGKGTQIEALSRFLNEHGESSIEYVQSGQKLREFIAGDTYTSKHTRIFDKEGKLYPTFIAIWSWTDKMIETFSGQNIVFVDGAPRKLNEALILDEMFDFYERNNRYVIVLDVSDECATARLKSRGRNDDLDEKNISTRLNWFHENSSEIISFFEKTNKYKITTINGEQSVEKIQEDIIKFLEL